MEIYSVSELSMFGCSIAAILNTIQAILKPVFILSDILCIMLFFLSVNEK